MLSALILTYNEALHIERCIASIRNIAAEIVVVDSFSTDGTAELARDAGARVLQHAFVNHAQQLNWGLQHVSKMSDWVLRIDADEYLTSELATEIRRGLCKFEGFVTGLVVRRRVIFLGKAVRFGGFGDMPVLRLWRNGCARCENRWMDEHMVLESGRTRKLKGVLVDDNLNDINWWTQKHLGYAAREAVELLRLRNGGRSPDRRGSFGSWQVRVRRFLKEEAYRRLPLGVRPSLYYLFRMTFQLGFLDTPRIWLFHFLQGLWYRTIVDIRVWQVEQRMSREEIPLADAIERELGINRQDLT